MRTSKSNDDKLFVIRHWDIDHDDSSVVARGYLADDESRTIRIVEIPVISFRVVCNHKIASAGSQLVTRLRSGHFKLYDMNKVEG